MGEHETALVSQLDFGSDGLGLIPVVTQDIASREVLVMAFVNQAALAASRQSSYATFWSRSRKTLWQKGETSGNRLKIREIRVNCEQNSLLFLVELEGSGACHAPRRDGQPHFSCYYRRVNSDDSLTIIDEAD